MKSGAANQEKNPVERKLPYDLDVERSLLGAILTNPESINRVNEFLKESHFFDPLHKKIYATAESLTERGLTVTPNIIKNALEKDPLFNEYGGASYLGGLCSLALTVINAKDYGRIVYDSALKRYLISIGEEIVNEAYASSFEDEAEKQIEKAEVKLYGLASEGTIDKRFVKIDSPLAESINAINRAMKSGEKVIGITTGLLDLDEKLSGFHNSDLVILAGRPGMGKTAFALNLALNAASSLKKKHSGPGPVPSVGFFSLEMSSEQLTHRLLSMKGSIDSHKLRTGHIKESDYENLMKSSKEIGDLDFFIDDTPALSISAIRTRARRLKRKHSLGILFIDYLQLIRGSAKSENRVLEISEITQGLKALAKELDIPVIALSQLSRAVEQREDKRPILSDLRESGTIEQDADLVAFIHRDEYYLRIHAEDNKTDEKKREEWHKKIENAQNKAEIIIAKHRNGPTGTVNLYYEAKFSKFSNLAGSSVVSSRNF